MGYRFCRLVVVYLLVPLYCVFPQSPLSRMTELIQEFNTMIEELAKSSVLQSHDSYFVNDLFLSIVRQNPFIEAVAKTDPQGIIVNRITKNGSRGVSKRVAGERWFSTVAGNRKPYSDFWSEPSGRIFLLRAWPLIDTSTDSSRFVGIFTVKIDVQKFLGSLSITESLPVQIAYKDEIVASSRWREGVPFSQETMALPGGGLFTVRFQSPADSGQEQSERMAASWELTENHTRAPSTVQELIPVSKKHAAKPILAEASHQNWTASFTARPLTSIVLNDSFLIGSKLPALSNGRFVFIIVFSILTLIAIAISLVIVFRQMVRKNSDSADTDALSPGPIDAFMIPGASFRTPVRMAKKVSQPQSAEIITDTAAAERETRELPALRELITESSRKLKCMDQSVDAVERDRLLREIHENLSIWVTGELQHLTSHLGSLSQSIRECENRDGNSAEFQVLRYEVERIITDIQDVERKVPKEIFK